MSVISLLSLANPPDLQTIEQMPISSSYLPHHQSTLITPLSIIQALLPLLSISATTPDKRDCSVVCLVPAAARIGIPLCGCQAMSLAGFVTSLEVLRRELAVTHPDTRVVIVDVGLIHDVATPNLRSGYFRPISRQTNLEGVAGVQRSHRGRTPSELHVLEAVVQSVLGKRLESPKQRFWAWFRGDHFSIGSGGEIQHLACS